MDFTFFRSLQSEWLKTRRSLASWMVIIGGFFIPLMMTVAALAVPSSQPERFASPDFWMHHWSNHWEAMAMFLLPVGVILATGLITQIEYRNNTWKQVMVQPQSAGTVYFAKLSVILLMMLQFFVLFNIGMYLSMLIPVAILGNTHYPDGAFPAGYFLHHNLLFFLDCLPVVALQYLLSLRFRNFLIPFGIGFLMWIGSLFAIRWKYGFSIPYTPTLYHFISGTETPLTTIPGISVHHVALFYFILFTVLGYVMFLTKKER